MGRFDKTYIFVLWITVIPMCIAVLVGIDFVSDANLLPVTAIISVIYLAGWFINLSWGLIMALIAYIQRKKLKKALEELEEELGE